MSTSEFKLRRRDRDNSKEITIIDNHTNMLFDEARQTRRASLPKSNYNPNGYPHAGELLQVCLQSSALSPFPLGRKYG